MRGGRRNIYECWEDREATFLIGGEQCTRRCDFCQIDTGKPAELDRIEPRRVAESVQAMGLRYSTITGVARDDLPDGVPGCTPGRLRAIHRLQSGTGVENLIPDFHAKTSGRGVRRPPRGAGAQLETVPRIFKRIRPAFRYERSLDVLTAARDFGLCAAVNLILGMGETPEEVREALADLYDAGCDIVTITQYLRLHAIIRWNAGSKPEEFVEALAVRRGARIRRGDGRARWCARPIALDGSTPRRWPVTDGSSPPAMAHLAEEGSTRPGGQRAGTDGALTRNAPRSHLANPGTQR